MVNTAWENRDDSGTNVRYLVFTKETADSSTFEESMVYGLLNGDADSNGVVVNPADEATAGYEIGFIIIDFITINGISLGIPNINYVTDIVFTGSVTELGDNIFQGSGVTTLKVTEGVTNISLSVLGGSSVSNITVDANNTNFSAENGYLYNQDKTKLILCPPNDDPTQSRATVTLNSATTTIGEEACAYVNYVTGVDLTNITSIEANAFKSTSMRTITNILRRTDENGDINNSSSTLAVDYGVFDGTLIQDTFDKAASITERVDVDTIDENDKFTISYDPSNPNTATNEEQTYPVTVTVVEEVSGAMGGNTITLTATKIFYEIVAAVSNSAPIFTSPATFSVPENQTSIGTVIATDPEGGIVYYSITGGADAGDFIIDQTSGVLSFANAPDYETKSNYTVIVTASDGTNNATQTITVNVINANDAPTFTSTPVTTAKTGLLYTYEVKTSDPDGGFPEITATTIPSWLFLYQEDEKLEGTPTNSDVGSHNVVLTARDSNGATATQAFTISVSQFKPADKDALQSAIDKWYALANDTNAVTTANNYDGPEYFGNPNTWDTSLITDLSYVFFKKDQENHPDISTWDVSNVTSMQGTFSNSTFNGELKNWNVASVTDFSYTFANNVVFNQELKRWNVQDAITMKSMFDNAYSFNQTIEPPMMQNKDGKDFPTPLTWDETKVNGYLETIYGSATPQTNPTTFKGVFGMIALLKKTYLDNIPNDPAVVGKYNTIKSSFSEVISELITNQQEILKYNYTYDETDGWTKTSQTTFSANTKDKSGNDLEGDELKEARDKLNQVRINTIADGMLLINRAYDMAKSLGETDFKDLIDKTKILYDDVYANLPFYVAWYACHGLTTKAKFLRNAFTFHNGATVDADGETATIDPKLTSFIATNPIKSIINTIDNTKSNQANVKSTSIDLYEKFKTAYKS